MLKYDGYLPLVLLLLLPSALTALARVAAWGVGARSARPPPVLPLLPLLPLPLLYRTRRRVTAACAPAAPAARAAPALLPHCSRTAAARTSTTARAPPLLMQVFYRELPTPLLNTVPAEELMTCASEAEVMMTLS